MQPTRRLGRAALLSPEGYRLPIWSCSGWGLPCRSGHPGRGELLPRLFTLTRKPRNEAYAPSGRSGGIFSVALSLGSPPLGVTQHPALWSSDFPPSGKNPAATALPASILFIRYRARWRGFPLKTPWRRKGKSCVRGGRFSQYYLRSARVQYSRKTKKI